MHPYDWKLFFRTLGAGSVGTAVAVVIVMATDESTSTAAMRVARVTAIAPALSAAAVLGISAHARVTGEVRSLTALGVHPLAAVRGAALAGVLLGVLGLAVLVSPFGDVTSLFPTVHAARHWDFVSGVARSGSHSVTSLGHLYATAGRDALDARVPTAWDALPCVAPLALFTPLWAAIVMPHSLRFGSALMTGFLAVIGLHAIAAGRVSTAAAAVSVLPLVAASVLALSLRRSA